MIELDLGLTACQSQDRLYKCHIVLHVALKSTFSDPENSLKINSPVSVAINRCNVGNQTNVCGSRLIQLTNISSRIIPSCVYLSQINQIFRRNFFPYMIKTTLNTTWDVIWMK